MQKEEIIHAYSVAITKRGGFFLQRRVYMSHLTGCTMAHAL